MRRMMIMLWILCVVFPISAIASTQDTYCTAREVYEDVQATLDAGNGDGTMTLQTRKGPLTFCVVMPDVDQVPIPRITYAGTDTLPLHRPEGTSGFVPGADNNDPTLWRLLMGSWEELVGKETRYHTTRVRTEDDPDAMADGSPFTQTDALRFSESLLQTYAEPFGYDFRLDAIHTNSREYKAVDHGRGFVPYLDQPLTDTGYYELEYSQYLHGIPYWLERAPYLSGAKKGTPHIRPRGETWVLIFSPEHYCFQMEPIVETERVAEDIPLCPFEKILQAISEARAPVGNALRFGYIIRNDPEDEDTAIAIPYWLLLTDGIYLDNELYINAQTGEIIDSQRKDKDGHRDDAVWITWDGV